LGYVKLGAPASHRQSHTTQGNGEENIFVHGKGFYTTAPQTQAGRHIAVPPSFASIIAAVIRLDDPEYRWRKSPRRQQPFVASRLFAWRTSLHQAWVFKLGPYFVADGLGLGAKPFIFGHIGVQQAQSGLLK
jgi:hypothetical protein